MKISCRFIHLFNVHIMNYSSIFSSAIVVVVVIVVVAVIVFSSSSMIIVALVTVLFFPSILLDKLFLISLIKWLLLKNCSSNIHIIL